MKRWLVALLVLPAVTVLVSPGIIGRLAEDNLEHALNGVTTHGRDDYVVTRRSFERGWFTAEGRHRIDIRGGAVHDVLLALAGLEREDAVPALIIDTRIDHGPVPVTSLSRERGTLRPGLASTVSTVALDLGDGEPVAVPGKLYSDIGLTGRTASRYLLAAGSFHNEEFAATWEGADISFTVDDDERLRGAASMSVTALELPRDAAPAGLQLELAIDRVDARALAAVITELCRAEARASAGEPGGAEHAALASRLQRLLSAGGELRMDSLDLTLPQGKITAALRFELPETDTADPESWPSLLLALSASADVELSVAIVEALLEAQPDMQGLLAMGILQRKGDVYAVEAEYTQGILTVNGAPVPVPLPGREAPFLR